MKSFIFTLGIILMVFVSSCQEKKAAKRSRWQETAIENKDVVARVSYERLNSTSTPEVQIELNGVPFKMLWDTGATSTCISSLEFINLVKAGKISDDDLKGASYVTVADGSTVTVPVYNIKEVVIRGTGGEELKVYNVDISVMDNLGASMLLGQNVMKELPQYKFDDTENELVFLK